MQTLKEFYLNYEVFFNMATTLLQIVNIAVIIAIYRYFRGSTLKVVDLSCGSFTIRKRHFDVQTITNLVSQHFYNGGKVPDDIRKEILKITSPPIKDKVEKIIKPTTQDNTDTKPQRRKKNYHQRQRKNATSHNKSSNQNI